MSLSGLFIRLRKSALLILLISILTLFLEHRGWLLPLENTARDTVELLKPSRPSQAIKIVGIDDLAFKDFGGHYPLDPSAVKTLLIQVAAANPQIIGVDLDTSNWGAEDRVGLPERPPIIWARDARIEGDKLVPVVNVLGDAKGALASDTGIAALPTDPDGLFRRYRPVFETTAGALPSLPWAIVAKLKDVAPIELTKPRRDIILNFAGDAYDLQPFPAQLVAQLWQSEGWASKGPLTGRIVLVGGFYHEAHDTHPTPFGTKFGVQLMAQAVGSDWENRGIRIANEAWMVALEVLIGFLLVTLHAVFPLRPALLSNIGAFLVLAPLCSWVAFSSFALWANFVPVLLAVIFHQLYEQAKENRNLKLANIKLADENTILRHNASEAVISSTNAQRA